MNRLLLLLALTVSASVARAAVRVDLSSPTISLVRAGKAAALHVSADGLVGSTLTLAGESITPVEIPITAGRVEATVPLYWTATPASLTWTDQAGSSGSATLPLHPLSANERLVLVAGNVADLPTVTNALFERTNCRTVPLDLSQNRLVWPTVAFEAADAVVLDAASATRVDESQIPFLLAMGTTLAVQSEQKPVGVWPWVQQGDCWVLRHEVAGPTTSAEADTYLPTYAWNRSWPASQRKAVLLAVALGVLVLIGVSLWRGRGGFLACAGVCVIALAAAVFYVGTLEPAVWAEGVVVSRRGDMEQVDRYLYVSAQRDARPAVRAGGIVQPIFSSQRQREQTDLRLLCSVDGSPERYVLALAAKQTVVFRTRVVRTTPVRPAELKPSASVPISLVADKLYRGQNVGADEQAPSDAVGDWWGTVWLEP